MSNNVVRYTPDAVKDNTTFQKLYEIHRIEIDNLHGSIKRTVDDSYIDSMSEDRIAQWEEVLLLPTDSTMSPTVRIKAIKDYLNFLPPITRYKLEDMIILKYGVGNYYLKINKETFEVIVGVETAPTDFVEYMYGWFKMEKILYSAITDKTYSQLMKFRGVSDTTTNALLADQSFRKLLRKIVPANMQLTFAIMFMYSYLRGLYTYTELEQYTYAYLSQYSDWEDEYNDRGKEAPLITGHTLNLSQSVRPWHTPPYVENNKLYMEMPDAVVSETSIVILL